MYTTVKLTSSQRGATIPYYGMDTLLTDAPEAQQYWIQQSNACLAFSQGPVRRSNISQNVKVTRFLCCSHD